MVRISKYCCLSILSTLFPLLVFAQVGLSTSVTPQQGSLDDFFQFHITVKGDLEGQTPQLSPTPDFETQYIGPRSSVSIINGVVSQEVTFVYRLIPKKEGSLQTPAVTIQVGSQQETAPSLTVKVDRSLRPKPTRSKQFFLQEELSPLSVYLGEQIVHTVKLFSKTRIHEFTFDKLIFDGFWGEAIDKVDSEKKYLSGNQYDVRTFKQALYPIRQGTLRLDSRPVVAAIGAQRGSPFGRSGLFGPNIFSFQTTERRQVDTQPTEVTVVPLPDQPANILSPNILYFDTTILPVGKTTLSAEQSADSINFGESTTVTIRIQSFGNLNPIAQIPTIHSPKYKLYEDTPTISSQELDGKNLMRKSFRFSLVPLTGGTINLPPFGVLYFDPLSKTYKTAQTEPLSLHVAGGPESQSSKSQTQQPPTPQQGEKPSTTPAAPQYEEETTLQSLSQQISPSLALLVLCLTVLSIVAIVVYLRIFQKASGRRKLLIKIEESTSADMLQRAFFLYAAQVLGELDDMNTIRERIREHLAQTDTEENTLYAFELLMDEIDAALYGNRDLSQRIMELRSKALEIAKNLT